MEIQKWHSGYVPDGYPQKCSIEEILNVVQDLNEEYRLKLQQSKNNPVWEKVILNLVQSGKDELIRRNSTPTFVATGGAGGSGGFGAGGGGGGGGGPGGGRGGDGGSVIIMQSSGQHANNSGWRWIRDHLVTFIFSIIGAAIIFWLGWN